LVAVNPQVTDFQRTYKPSGAYGHPADPA